MWSGHERRTLKTHKKLEKRLISYENSRFAGPSGEIRTPGVLNPNQVPYQLGHTRILSFFRKSTKKEDFAVLVKYVVKPIL